MAGRVRADDIEEIKARVNIADVIAEYVALRPASAGSLKGLCPFHSEKSPSFNVRSNPGFYHCFGCGAGGDVVKFLQEIESLSFADAIERLAARIGYELRYEDGANENSGRSRLLAANKAAAEFFRRQILLSDAEVARSFVLSRGFTASDAEHFQIGFAPRGWRGLCDALRELGFTDQELVEAGLASRGDRGVYDKFRGRIIWPIRDANGQVLGFGARKLFDDDEGPKYLNTSDTPVYHKSSVLYGLDLARKSIVKTRQIIVVEGYTDVMACHLAGFDNAVATCGTAFGEEHIRVINRLFGQTATEPASVVFTFDPDAAGQKAALRVYSDSHKFNALTFVAVGPDGLDPADLRQQRGDDAIAQLIQNKRPLFEFVIRHRVSKFDLSDLSARVAAARSAGEVVAALTDPALQSAYTRMLADLVSLEVNEVAQLVSELKRGQVAKAVSGLRMAPANAGQRDHGATNQPGVDDRNSVQNGKPPTGQPEPTFDKRELLLVEVVIQQSQHVPIELVRRISAAGIQSARLQQILAVASASGSYGDTQLLFEELRRKLGPEAEELLIRLLTAELPVVREEEIPKYCNGVVTAALVTAMNREKTDLLQVLRRLDSATQQVELQQVQQQLVELEQERRRLIG